VGCSGCAFYWGRQPAVNFKDVAKAEISEDTGNISSQKRTSCSRKAITLIPLSGCRSIFNAVQGVHWFRHRTCIHKDSGLVSTHLFTLTNETLFEMVVPRGRNKIAIVWAGLQPFETDSYLLVPINARGCQFNIHFWNKQNYSIYL